MKAARAGHLCTVQFLISKGVLLTHFKQVKCTFLYISLPKCAKRLLSQFSFNENIKQLSLVGRGCFGNNR